MKKRLILSLLCFALFSGHALADTIFSFAQVTNGSINLSSQLQVSVSQYSATQISFSFCNNIGIASSITDIYFDDGRYLGQASIVQSPGVNFSAGATPPNLPAGNTIKFSTSFSADSNPPVVANGINDKSESLTIIFTLVNGKTTADVINALTSGEMRVGLHVQSIGNNGLSESYVTNVPEPSLVLLLGIGLSAAALAAGRLRSR
jgi:hypothetical protein